MRLLRMRRDDWSYAVLRGLWMLAGLFLLSYGIDLQRAADLGLMPWSVLHEGISLQTFLTFGQANILVGLVLICIGLVLGVKPSLGTIVTMTATGLFLDLILQWHLIPIPSRSLGSTGVEPWRYLYMILGVVVMGFGTAWYVSANLGAGPRDGLMIGIARLTRWPVGPVRSGMEAMALLTGWLLGGPVGIGTVCGVLGLGWTIQFSLIFFRWLQRAPVLGRILSPPVLDRPAVKGAS